MPLASPQPGLVISYSYLWSHEHETGFEEGRKDRPCVIVLTAKQQGESTVVTVAPITHWAPSGPTIGIEIPRGVKSYLGLDDKNSWIVVSEVNQFVWPGYDLRPIVGSRDQYHYGFLPVGLFEKVTKAIVSLIAERRLSISPRN